MTIKYIKIQVQCRNRFCRRKESRRKDNHTLLACSLLIAVAVKELFRFSVQQKYFGVGLVLYEGKVLLSAQLYKNTRKPFWVISLTFPDCLIPYHMGLNGFAAEVLRFLHICSHDDFVFVKTRKTFE